jgi:hypothetical protein
MIYVPNIGEMEALKDILVSQAFRLGLYKAHVTPDGNTIFSTITELDAEAGGYATKDLSNDICEDALTADKWYFAVNSDGKAEATYDAADTPQEWLFNAADVANGDTAYGIFMWALTIAFTGGDAAAIKVGDTVASVVGGETAIVTSIRLTSGTWGVDAAGVLCLKTQSGVFQAGGLNVSAVGLADIAGDTDKQLILVEAFSAGQAIDTVGQKIQYTPKITLSTG